MRYLYFRKKVAVTYGRTDARTDRQTDRHDKSIRVPFLPFGYGNLKRH